MNDREEVIHTNPAGILCPFHMNGMLTGFVLDAFGNIFGNRFNLRIGIAFANDKKVGRSIIQFSQIQFQDVFAFNILDAFNYHVVQSFGLRRKGRFFFQNCLCTQNWDKFTFGN